MNVTARIWLGRKAPLATWFAIRRVIERNGVPVPRHEIDRQDAEYRARVARVQRYAADADDDDRLRELGWG